jgi:hypothetical protein
MMTIPVCPFCEKPMYLSPLGGFMHWACKCSSLHLEHWAKDKDYLRLQIDSVRR